MILLVGSSIIKITSLIQGGCFMWFRNKENDLENHLVDMYAAMKSSVMGLSKGEGQKMAREMLMLAKDKVKQYGFDKLPPNFGDYILQKEKEDSKFMNMNIKREDGVQDADIKWFWNMHPVERCMMEVDDENSRLAAFTHYSEAGMIPENAAKEMRKFHPMFGDPKDTQHAQGDDRPLPVELKDRINRWLEKNMSNPQAFKDRLSRYSTMNSFIRAEIKAGNI